MKRVNDSEETKARQSKRRAQFPLLLFFLSLVLAAVVFWVTPGFVGYENVPIPENDFDYHFNNASMLRVALNHNGDIYLNERAIDNVGDLSRMIKRSIAGIKNQKSRVILLADKRVQYGKIATVLGQVKLANVDSVFLEYQERASILEVLSGNTRN